jgi:hypothetical protein
LSFSVFKAQWCIFYFLFKNIVTIDFYNFYSIILRGFFCCLNIGEMTTLLSQKIPKLFSCEMCHYNTCNSKDFKKHMITKKHKNNELKGENNGSNNPKCPTNTYQCKICEKIFKDRAGLWRHKKKCTTNNEGIEINETCLTEKQTIELLIKQNMELIKENSEFKNMMMEQQDKLIEIQTWKQQYPDCTKSDSRKNDLYLKIVSNSMSGINEEECEKNISKIISNVVKETAINKDSLVI